MLGALAAAVDSTASAGAAVVAQNLSTREPYFLERWVDDEWGRRGVAFLHDLLGGPDEFLSTVGGFDAALDRFDETFAESLSL